MTGNRDIGVCAGAKKARDMQAARLFEGTDFEILVDPIEMD
jgi:hypothetical protein